MPRQKKDINLQEMALKIRNAGIDNPSPPNKELDTDSDVADLSERIHEILNILNSPNRNKGNMLFFIMYDIESNKVRRLVAKYLERKGCTRVQNSVFLADLDTSKYQQIRDDLAEVQAMYDNHDSILICPVSTDLIRSMKIIGKNINIDLITRSKSTFFF